MTTTIMRERLIAYLTSADDKKITGLYSLLEENIHESSHFSFSKEQLDFLYNERKKHLSGESISYNWEEVKDMIRNKKAS